MENVIFGEKQNKKKRMWNNALQSECLGRFSKLTSIVTFLNCFRL